MCWLCAYYRGSPARASARPSSNFKKGDKGGNKGVCMLL